MKVKPEDLSCFEVQRSIKQYLLDEMTTKEAEKFVVHVRSCEECRKELEEYYAFSSALMNMDTIGDTEKSDFFMNIEKRLERTEQAVAKERKEHKKRRITYIVLAVAVAVAMSMSAGV